MNGSSQILEQRNQKMLLPYFYIMINMFIVFIRVLTGFSLLCHCGARHEIQGLKHVKLLSYSPNPEQPIVGGGEGMEEDMSKGGRGKMMKTVEKLKQRKSGILRSIQRKSKKE